ncbi:MAG TPA: aminotransferase class V-fold PLP-dependent enzyme [Acidimicrobiales bacterium]|nr:aminotransferase class V-fold PLP-dependent enzyme [Acidimicrobiales bacterium]
MDDPLGLDAETMRTLGYRTVDFLVDVLTDTSAPALRRATRAEMEGRLAGPPPEQGEDFEHLLAQLARDVIPYTSRGDHPAYFAFIPSCGTWPGALGDLIASAVNVFAGSWMESPGPSQLELTLLDWFKEWIGYPRTAAGVLVSGGSAANMTALACAREALLGPMSDKVVVYCSDQAHSSVARGARVLGFRPDQVRVLPVDADYRLRAERVEAAMDADLAAGRQPLLVSASAGGTNTGAVDALGDLARLCRRRRVWFHVDGAYGGFAALTERGRRWLGGIEEADSVTLDPHKWLYQPFECGCLLVREGRLLREAFEITPDYLHDAETKEREVNFSDLGIQLSRMARAFKLWMSLRYFGVDAFRAAVDRSLDLAAYAQQRIESSPELELLLPANLSVVCFRRRPPAVEDEHRLESANARIVADLARTGIGLISSTRLQGRYALRMCVLNHTSRKEDVDRVLGWIERASITTDTRSARRPAVQHERHPQVGEGWLARSAVERGVVASVPLFHALDEAAVTAVTAVARTQQAAPGETIVQQWDCAREFYVIVEGTASVHADGTRVAELGAGDFFGELAALDWGASFGYPRLATVVAETPMRLLVLPGASLNDLARNVPEIGRRIQRAKRVRLSELAELPGRAPDAGLGGGREP